MPDKIPSPNQQSFDALLQQIRHTRQAVFAQVNTALIELYWQVGQTISAKVQAEGWGKSVVAELARYLSQNAPELKGFSDKNLWRMKQFYETYAADEKLSPLVRELPWTQNTIIFSRCNSREERTFYLTLAARQKWSKRELERQIDSAQFERVAIGQQKLPAALKELHPAAEKVFKDSYVLEFLGLPEQHNEGNLQKALLQHIKAWGLGRKDS